MNKNKIEMLEEAVEVIKEDGLHKLLYGGEGGYHLGEEVDKVAIEALQNQLAIEKGEMVLEQGWLPIEEAPKDGTHILCYVPYGGGFITETWWQEDKGHKEGVIVRYWYCEGGEYCPTHFRPLPQPPKGNE